MIEDEQIRHDEQPWTAQTIRDYFAEYPSLEEAAAAIADEWNQNNEYTDIVRAERDALEAKWASVPWDDIRECVTIAQDDPDYRRNAQAVERWILQEKDA